MSDHKHDDCGCGHDHDDEHDENIILLTDEDGAEHEMVMVYTFESQDQAYAVLLDRNEPDADAVIFRIEEENEETFLVNIQDDQEWERVTALYEEIAAKSSENE